MSEIALIDFLADVFYPDRYGDTKPSHQTTNKYRCAVRQLDLAIGRPVAVDELTDNHVDHLDAHLQSNGYPEPLRRKYRSWLRTIGNHARSKGYELDNLSVSDHRSKDGRSQKANRLLRGPRDRTCKQIIQAATMFAKGIPFAEIADEMKLTVDAIKNYRSRYPKHWELAYREASVSNLTEFKKQAAENAEVINRQNHHRGGLAAQKAAERYGKPFLSFEPKDEPLGLTLTEYFERHFLSERDINRNSQGQYRVVIRQVERWAGRKIGVAEFRAEWINRFLMDTQATVPSSYSVRRAKVHVAALWRSSFEAGQCDVPVQGIRKVKLPVIIPQAWTRPEVEILLATTRQLDGDYRFDWTHTAFWSAIIRAAWDTGLRQSDLFKIGYADITDEGYVHIVQGKVNAWVPARLRPSTIEVVRRYRCRGQILLFPWSYSGEYFRRHFKQIVERAELIGSFKKLRKASASDVEANHPGHGSRHLGHSANSAIGPKNYFDPRITMLDRPMPKELNGGAA